MVSPEHLNAELEVHRLTDHRSAEERLLACEELLAAHGLRLDAFDAALTAHAAEEIEIVEVDVEDSPDASVEVTAPEAEATGGDAASGSDDAGASAGAGDDDAAGAA